MTVNGNQFYFDFQNGQYGYNTDPARGADTFSPFNRKAIKIGEVIGPNLAVTGTLDVKSYYPTTYKSLSIDDFIIERGAVFIENQLPYQQKPGFTWNPGYSYNSETGIITGTNLREDRNGLIATGRLVVYGYPEVVP